MNTLFFSHAWAIRFPQASLLHPSTYPSPDCIALYSPRYSRLNASMVF